MTLHFLTHPFPFTQITKIEDLAIEKKGVRFLTEKGEKKTIFSGAHSANLIRAVEIAKRERMREGRGGEEGLGEGVGEEEVIGAGQGVCEEGEMVCAFFFIFFSFFFLI